ncbi:MAG: bifunctional methylenetetrahydrofolate dehydrogenase/methenyltetrahydrofolate cyclohydrolase FolD [Francisellaceae bacterium]|jgi:methylenetetrahydrofolate dehydrogenase (NADP+) / methenyltetrahydrofolate cyclohydrolase|nr:bifunctional methylenetetrahydrofolate dehydrogenase/methenyltetrahydrofolate cyclohydrolase FolD [Francisellaceae bacterium]MBT6538453.1 bifunctional methylenetetrahydrofolate dehydrogenase/methenyltetrahydrofolate cyclohydrolase FolD [Francisellaceae bacterium]
MIDKNSDKLLKGNIFADKLISDVNSKVIAHMKNGYRAPQLAVILIGNDPASSIYVNKKQKKSKEAGIKSSISKFDNSITENELLKLISTLNQDSNVDGILVQLPIPQHINQQKILESISPDKDVDGFHPINVGRLMQRNPHLRPCTPFGIINMLNDYNIELKGLNAVVVGASNIVGRPMSLELLLAGVTVTICHRFTQNLADIVSRADLVVAGVGQPEIIKGNWLKEGSIVIDVGINRLESGKLVGDIEFKTAIERVKYITPVPGGVGPVTVAQLMANTLFAFEHNLIGSTTN